MPECSILVTEVSGIASLRGLNQSSLNSVTMNLKKIVTSFLVLLTVVVSLNAKIGVEYQMQLGNPSSASTDTTNHSHYLIERAQYAMDYNDVNGQPNWVSWDLTTEDVGSSGRSNFFQDTTLPAGFYQVLTTDYSGSGYDRGHMCPSADRTVTVADNQVVFFMSNMIPQAPDNNQGVWAVFETYCRTLASEGNELLITSGPGGFGGSRLPSGAAAIPGYTWKIVVVVPLGAGLAVDRIDTNTRVIAIKIPNIAGVRSDPWQNYITTVAQIEADTGFSFFSNLPTALATVLKTKLDGQSATGIPVITSPPVTQTTVVGGSAMFAVTAIGDAPLNYQWFKDDVLIDGANGSVLTLDNVQASDMGNYDVVVSNAVGATTSTSAKLIILGLPPVVTASPVSQTINAGSNVTFAVTVSGSPTLAYQWRKDGTPISGATSATLTLVNAQAGDIGGYDVVVSNSVNTAISDVALLLVTPSAPSITGQPAAQTSTTGGNASFSVLATGTDPLSYQWYKDGVALANGGSTAGADSATLSLTGISAINAGSYNVQVGNALGSITSASAILTINAPPPSTVNWDFGASGSATASPSSGLSADIMGGVLTQGNNNGTTALLTTTSASSSYTGASGANNAGAAARIGALNQAAGGSAYFEFTLAPSAGKRLSVSGISFGLRSTGTGPQAFAVYTSRDSFASPVATGTTANDSSWHLYAPAFTAQLGDTAQAVTFRIYGYNGVGSPGANTANWRLDDLKLAVSAVYPPPVAPVVISTIPADGANSVAASSPVSITFNEAVSFTGSWFTLTSARNGTMAAAVTGGPTTYTITPPSNFDYTDVITVTVLGAQVVDQATGTIHGTTNTTFTFDTADYVPPSPPTVTTQPLSQNVSAESAVTFSVAASGTAPFSYQWRKNGTAISGNSSATSSTLTLANVMPADNGSYDCLVTNIAGSDVSQAAALIVNLVQPSVTSQPVSQMVTVGGNAVLNVTATGTAPLTYQWRKGGVPLANSSVITGADQATLTLTGVSATDTGSYDVVITNGAGFATSNAASLVVSASAPDAIYWDFTSASPISGLPAEVTGGTLTQGNNNGTTTLLTTTSVSSGYTGASGTFNAGAAARIGALNQGAAGSAYFEFTFTPVAGKQFAATALSFGTRSTGTGPQAYAIFTSVDNFTAPVASGTLTNNSAWRLISAALPGVTGSVGEAVTFRIYGYNGAGSASANTANWRIDDLKLTAGLLAIPPVPPTVVTEPQAVTVNAFEAASFTVGVTGTAPFTYQWRRNGTPITDNASASTDSLVLTSVTTADAADYDCVVNNIAGTVTTDAASLTVNKLPASVTLGDLLAVYDGSAKLVSITTDPAGLATSVTYNGSASAPAQAGSYLVVATITDANYTGSASGQLTIAKASATVTLGALKQRYDGTPRVATATTEPSGLNVVLTYAGDTTAPTLPGWYAINATIDDANYAGSVSGTLLVTTTALVRHLTSLNGDVDGSVQVLTAENITLNSNAGIYGDLLVAGTPTIRLNSSASFAGTIDAAGEVQPAGYVVTLNGAALLRNLVRRVNPLAIPVVSAPPAPSGTRSVSINQAGQSAGDFATLRHLTLNSSAGLVAVPPGTYGNLIANGSSGFILGVAGATEPAIYNLQNLTLNGTSRIQLAGPVILTLASGTSVNGSFVGDATHPQWLTLRVASGGLTLNSSACLHGTVIAPSGTLTLNGTSTLTGEVIADRLIINSQALLREPVE